MDNSYFLRRFPNKKWLTKHKIAENQEFLDLFSDYEECAKHICKLKQSNVIHTSQVNEYQQILDALANEIHSHLRDAS